MKYIIFDGILKNHTMIATISISLCFASMIAGTVLLFVFASKTNASLNLLWGGIALLLITLFTLFCCFAAQVGQKSCFDSIYQKERADCIAATAAKKKQSIPVIPPIKLDIITVTIQ